MSEPQPAASEPAAQSAAAAPAPATRAYRAIFFDLDGTLLPMEVEEFMGAYMKSLGGYVSRHGGDPQAFAAAMQAGIKGMAHHDPELTNEQAFFQAFYQQVEGGPAEWEPLFSDYYENVFPQVGNQVKPSPAAARALKALAGKGYTLVLATMPMFPLTAVRSRLRWAGVDPDLFSRLTSFENSRSVKPHLSYYAENLAACNVAGSDVLMVGNNTVEDLAAMGAGTDGYLVTDFLLDAIGLDLGTVKHGTLEDFADWAETLPACQNPATAVETGSVAPEDAQCAYENNVSAQTADAQRERLAAGAYEIDEHGVPATSAAAARRREV